MDRLDPRGALGLCPQYGARSCAPPLARSQAWLTGTWLLLCLRGCNRGEYVRLWVSERKHVCAGEAPPCRVGSGWRAHISLRPQASEQQGRGVWCGH